ncbi:MAG: hypothetical protein ACKVP3_11220 [Hyphomicrobiaceae bacterium]
MGQRSGLWATACRSLCACLFAILMLASPATTPGLANRISPELQSRLSESQLRQYQAYLQVRSAFDRQLDDYWDDVEDKREARRRKRSNGQAFARSDYILEQPPKYTGPPVPPDVARIIASLKEPEPEAEPRPGVADFLANAKTHFSFVPTPTTERIFKRRYAEEALAAGLTKMQVVRVYALETGGRGTYDMQAGIDPDTRQGKPISSALGYAQLLSGNSVNELLKHGPRFIERLNAMAAERGVSGSRAASLRNKAQAVARMLRAARSVPNHWNNHVKLGAAPKGQGIHTLNLDADVGPWLQVQKLKDVLQTAVNAGRPELTPAELELMNLAGPRTGLDMMEKAGRDVPTSNFFSRTGYYRNTIVRERTSAELLAAIDERMAVNIQKPGAVEFITIFDEVMRESRVAR